MRENVPTSLDIKWFNVAWNTRISLSTRITPQFATHFWIFSQDQNEGLIQVHVWYDMTVRLSGKRALTKVIMQHWESYIFFSLLCEISHCLKYSHSIIHFIQSKWTQAYRIVSLDRRLSLTRQGGAKPNRFPAKWVRANIESFID